jgi:hypothetical protein
MTDHGTTGRRKSDRVGPIARLSLRTGSSSWTSRTALIVCLGMLIAGGLAYYNYINHREAFLVKETFRSLEELSRNISNTTKGYVKLLEPFALQADQLPKLLQFSPESKTKAKNDPTNIEKDPVRSAQLADSRCFSRSPVSFSKELKDLELKDGLKDHFRLVLSSLCSERGLRKVGQCDKW